jgi:hypothetical protein
LVRWQYRRSDAASHYPIRGVRLAKKEGGQEILPAFHVPTNDGRHLFRETSYIPDDEVEADC